MIIYNRYVNQEDHVWYDSSNIVYSKCYDTQNTKFKTLKIVFKGGRTYVYRNVDADDYIIFKTATSNGQEFNKRIKKYDAVRILNQPLHLPQKIQAQGLCFFVDNVSNSTIHAQAYICRNL